MIELERVTKRYGKLTVLDNFSLSLPDSGVIAMMGPSGCGKTTLLRLIAGLERADAGDVKLADNARVSMVFQEDRLIPGLTAKGNVMAVLPPVSGSAELAERMLFACGLKDFMHLLPGELSGGMRRRVAVARAVAYGGDILLLDEPFKGLDAETRDVITSFVFSSFPKDSLILLVTHDPDEAGTLASGVLQFCGPPLTLR